MVAGVTAMGPAGSCPTLPGGRLHAWKVVMDCDARADEGMLACVGERFGFEMEEARDGRERKQEKGRLKEDEEQFKNCNVKRPPLCHPAAVIVVIVPPPRGFNSTRPSCLRFPIDRIALYCY